MSSLPLEMITIILIHLPVKSLLRFRCVSKSWCSQIDSPDFIKLHLTYSITSGSNSNHSSINQLNGTIYSLDFDSLVNLVKIETPFPRNNVYTICNGLVLLGNDLNSPSLIISNPSTRKHLLLPAPPPNSKYADLTSYQGFVGLGYDVINDDYKVFNVLKFADGDNKYITCEARIYSLKSNSWRIVKDFTKGMICDFPDFEVYANGALHTITDKECRTIAALDVGKEIINLLPMPNLGNMGDKNLSVTVVAFDGTLAVSCPYPDNRNDIWVMKEYGVKESWTMLLSMKPEYGLIYVKPLVYSKSRFKVLLRYHCSKHVWYDLRKKRVEGFEFSGFPTRFVCICVKNLVSVGVLGKLMRRRNMERRNEGRDCQEEEASVNTCTL